MSDKSRIYFLVKDPHWTFLWWKIDPECVAGGLMLRIHDITHIIFQGNNSHSYFDVEITGKTDHWYLNIPVCNRNYCAEIGIKTGQGGFLPLARSNPIYVPRDCPSDSPAQSRSRIVLR